jgi:GT2 family glycosyltransferase
MATRESAVRAADPEPSAEAPKVVAVVVTREPGPGLEDCLRSLRDQDYPDLTVLVVDSGSAADPTDRIAAAHPGARLRRLDRNVGFAAAVNEALGPIREATFACICHDDVVFDPSAVRILVEEAYRSNAGVVSPKLVDATNPRVLLEVGRAIDRLGAPYTGIEPGELDQEQHDSVRDVFYVSSAAMLVRSDLMTELGGFDAAAFPGAEDLLLCWRARLAGARVLVAPDARVRHRETATALRRTDNAAVARNRLRSVLLCYSRPTLLWLVPWAFALTVVEAVLLTVTRRRRAAWHALGAWWWSIRRFGAIRRARRRVQARRRVPDSELHDLQVGVNTRLRAWLSTHVHADDRLREFSDASRSWTGAAVAGLRQPIGLAALVVAAVYLVGSRDLLLERVPAVGSLAQWPGISDLFSAYASGWRYTGLGSSAAAPPALALMGSIGALLLGSVGFARTLVVVGAVPLGAVGAYRLARPFAPSALPAIVTATVYVATPVPRNAIANGRLGPLVLFGLAPFLVLLLLRASATGSARPRSRLRMLLGLSMLTAVAAASFIPALLFLPAIALALVLAVPLVGGGGAAARAVASALVATAGAVVLLIPWPFAYTDGPDAASLGFQFHVDLSLSEVLRLQSGPNGGGWAGWGLLVAAAFVLLAGSGLRLAWAARAWMLILVGFALAWMPGRFTDDLRTPAPEAALTLAALGLAIAVGLGVSARVADLSDFRFDWRQSAMVAAAIGGIAFLLAFAVDAVDGRWRAPAQDWPTELAWTEAETTDGGFRMLWLGDPTVLPNDPSVMPDGLGYVLTRDGPGDARDLMRAPERRADRLVTEAVELTVDGNTGRVGHLLAPMGVRYIAVTERAAPDGGASASQPVLLDALQDQLDLSRLETDTGLTLYENDVWAPTRALVPEGEEVPLDSADPTAAALRSDLTGAEPVDSEPVEPGTVLWSEAYDDEWRADGEGEELTHVEPFGWSNGYELGSDGTVALRYGGQTLRYALIALSLALWAAAVTVLVRSRTRRRRIAPAAVEMAPAGTELAAPDGPVGVRADGASTDSRSRRRTRGRSRGAR